MNHVISAGPDDPAAPLPNLTLYLDMPQRDMKRWAYLENPSSGKIEEDPSEFSTYSLDLDFSILPAVGANGLWGYIDPATNKTVIAPQFQAVDFFRNGFAIVMRAYPERAFVFTQRHPFYGDRDLKAIPVAEGLIDKSGRELLPARYSLAPYGYRLPDGVQMRMVPGVYRVETALGTQGLFRVGQGFIVPIGQPGPRGNRDGFSSDPTAEGGIVFDGVYYAPGGQRITAPDNSGVYRVDLKRGLLWIGKRNERGAYQSGLMRVDGSILIPAQYDEIREVPKAGIWLAIPDIERGRTSTPPHVDVYDARGELLRSIVAGTNGYPPEISGTQITYQTQGVEYTVDASTGETVRTEKPASYKEQEKERAAREQKKLEREDQQMLETVRSGGLLLFRQNDKLGLKVAADGTVRAPATYEGLKDLGGGIFAATRNRYRLGILGLGKGSVSAWSLLKSLKDDDYDARPNIVGLIDGNTGKLITPFIYAEIKSAYAPMSPNGLVFQAEQAHKKKGTAYYLLDRQGHLVAPENKPYDDEFSFNHAGVSPARRNGQWGLIDDTGKQLLPFEYSWIIDVDGDATSRQDARFLVTRGAVYGNGGQKGLYDGMGKELIPVQYTDINVMRTPYQSTELKGAVQNWFRVEDSSGTGWVNVRTGVVISPLEYPDIAVYPGFVMARVKGGAGIYVMLDSQGKRIADHEYESLKWMPTVELVLVKHAGKYGLLDGNGQQVYPLVCDNISEAPAPYLWCETGGRKILVDKTGKEYRMTDGQ